MRGGCCSLRDPKILRSLRHVKSYDISIAHRHVTKKAGDGMFGMPRIGGSGIGMNVRVSSATDIAELLVFSALPFVAVQALADSDAGKKLRTNLEARKPELQRMSREMELDRAVARKESPWYGDNRPLWLGRWTNTENVPQWLDGSLPGDYGYDPLSLGRNPEKLDRYFELELFHARWAMLAALGALLPEALQLAGMANFLEPVWWKVGAAKASGEDLNYLGIAGLRIAGGQGVLVIFIAQILLMFGPEYARYCGIEALEPLGIYLPGDKNYPGSWLFDPLDLASNPVRFERMRVREIKNGRLAMIAWLGFFIQAAVTKEGPVENLIGILRSR